MCVHVFFTTQDYVSVFYQDADNVEASGADDQAAEKQETGTGTPTPTSSKDEPVETIWRSPAEPAELKV